MTSHIEREKRKAGNRPGILKERVRKVSMIGLGVFFMFAAINLLLMMAGIWIPGSAW